MRAAVDEDTFSMEVRKFLKRLGASSQREIEGAGIDGFSGVLVPTLTPLDPGHHHPRLGVS